MSKPALSGSEFRESLRRTVSDTTHDDKMLIFALRDENDSLAAQNRELREALEGILAAADNSLGIWTPMIEPFKVARDLLAKAHSQ